MVLRRLANPDDARLGPPLKAVVTTVRSLLQPMSPDIGDIAPSRCPWGPNSTSTVSYPGWWSLPTPTSFMVAKRGEFAVRGGILDVFPQPPNIRSGWSSGATRSPRCGCSRWPISGRSPRSTSPKPVLWRCRAVSCSSPPRCGRTRRSCWRSTPRRREPGNRQRGRHAGQAGRGHRRGRHGGAEPLLRSGEPTLLTDHLPSGTPLLVCDPEKVRARAADLIKTGREFLEASWSVAAVGAGSDRHRGAWRLGLQDLDDVRDVAKAGGHPWWTLSQLGDEGAVELDVRLAPSARDNRATSTRFSPCCAPTY